MYYVCCIYITPSHDCISYKLSIGNYMCSKQCSKWIAIVWINRTSLRSVCRRLHCLHFWQTQTLVWLHWLPALCIHNPAYGHIWTQTIITQKKRSVVPTEDFLPKLLKHTQMLQKIGYYSQVHCSSQGPVQMCISK